MIIEIALGIVLAVIILSLLPLIFAVGAIALIVGVVVVLGGLLIYWAINSAETLIAVVSIVGVIVCGAAVAHFVAKKTLLTQEEAGGLMVITAVLGFAGFALFEQYEKFGDISTEALNLLPFLVLLAVLSVIMWRRVKSRAHGSKSEA